MRPPVPSPKGAKCSPRDSALDRKFIRDTCQTKKRESHLVSHFSTVQEKWNREEQKTSKWFIRSNENDNLGVSGYSTNVLFNTRRKEYELKKMLEWILSRGESQSFVMGKVGVVGIFKVLGKLSCLVKSLNQDFMWNERGGLSGTSHWFWIFLGSFKISECFFEIKPTMYNCPYCKI